MAIKIYYVRSIILFWFLSCQGLLEFYELWQKKTDEIWFKTTSYYSSSIEKEIIRAPLAVYFDFTSLCSKWGLCGPCALSLSRSIVFLLTKCKIYTWSLKLQNKENRQNQLHILDTDLTEESFIRHILKDTLKQERIEDVHYGICK